MKKTFLIAIVLMMSMAACTDAQRANLGSLGEAGDVKCYSGGKLIYEGRSTGKIGTVTNSDGWEFKDAKSGKFVRVTGDCLIEN